jgi:ABC-2 type transport system ATP-binding protein
MYGVYFDNVTKRFNDKTILDNSTFRVENGITLLISANGTGKSTIIYSIMGNYRVNSGKIYVNGYNPVKDHRKAFLNTSLMPEKPIYFGSGSVEEYIDLFSRLKGINKSEIYNYLSYFGVSGIMDSHISSLSMGEIQILYISCYLSGNFKLYIFDEPNSNLDQAKRKKFSEAVNRKARDSGSTFLITSHINDELTQFANNILTISQRKIITFKGKKTNNAYLVQFYDYNDMGKILDKLEYFEVNGRILIKNISINEIISVMPESNIKEIIRIPPAMVDYYENQK